MTAAYASMLTTHAARHVTGGADAIQPATASQPGLMTSAYASMLTTHAARHVTGGADAIQPATASQSGLMTAAMATALLRHRSGESTLSTSATTSAVAFGTHMDVVPIVVVSGVEQLVSARAYNVTTAGFSIQVSANSGTLHVNWSAAPAYNP